MRESEDVAVICGRESDEVGNAERGDGARDWDARVDEQRAEPLNWQAMEDGA